jgi:hypothetical protein
VAGYDNVAQAAAACGINIFLALDDGGTNWPSGFGTDAGQMAALHAAGLKLVAAGHTLGLETANNVSANSVASFQALDVAQGGGVTLVGYNMGDEPACGAPMNAIPAKAAAVAGYDSTRPNFCNHNPGPFWRPGFDACVPATIEALQATSVGSFDLYSFIIPYQQYSGSDFLSVPQDGMFARGLAIQNMRYHARPGQPVWAFVEGGSDCLGQAGEAGNFTGGIVNTSTTLTNNSNFSVFTSSWLGLTATGTGIQADTVIAEILTPTTARMSKAATATNAAVTVNVTGGDYNNCVASVNLCVVNGNRFRATPAEVAAEVWCSIVNGANGIEWFSHDAESGAQAYILGAAAGGAGAQEAAANLTYINGVLRNYAAILNAETVGICSMDSAHPTTGVGIPTVTDTCSDGILTMATSNIAVPGAAIAKSYNNRIYLIAQPSRRGSADMTFTLDGNTGRTALCVYDSNAQYAPDHSDFGESAVLDQDDRFTVTFGAGGNNYQTKIYEVA